MSDKRKLVVTITLDNKVIVRSVKKIDLCEINRYGQYGLNSVASILEEPFFEAKKKLSRLIKKAKEEKDED